MIIVLNAHSQTSIKPHNCKNGKVKLVKYSLIEILRRDYGIQLERET